MKTGDVIAQVATPVARFFKMDCVDPVTGQLRPESKCAKMRKQFNEGNYAAAFYDRFFKSNETGQETMNEYVVHKTTIEVFGIQADSIKQAQDAVMGGNGKMVQVSITFNVRPRQTSEDSSPAEIKKV